VKAGDWDTDDIEGGDCGWILNATLNFCKSVGDISWRVDYISTGSPPLFFCGIGPNEVPGAVNDGTRCLSYGLDLGLPSREGDITFCEKFGFKAVAGSGSGDASCVKTCPPGKPNCAPNEKQVVCEAVCAACSTTGKK
jgi:hypothetical protein